jgi:hypothetical protein
MRYELESHFPIVFLFIIFIYLNQHDLIVWRRFCACRIVQCVVHRHAGRH